MVSERLNLRDSVEIRITDNLRVALTKRIEPLDPLLGLPMKRKAGVAGIIFSGEQSAEALFIALLEERRAEESLDHRIGGKIVRQQGLQIGPAIMGFGKAVPHDLFRSVLVICCNGRPDMAQAPACCSSTLAVFPRRSASVTL